MTPRRAIVYLFAFSLGLRAIPWFAHAFWGQNFGLPYSEGYGDFSEFVQMFSVTGNLAALYKVTGYSYPPLFLYSLLPFYLLGGPNLAPFPIVTADAAMAPLVYIIVRRLANSRLALAAALSYALSPFALYYEGYVWYSSQPMAFFVLLSMYFLISEKPSYSLWTLAIAVLFKQQAVFLLPIPLAWLFVRNRGKLMEAAGGFAGILIAASLPFLVETPAYYLYYMSNGLLGRWLGIVPVVPKSVTTTCVNVSSNAQGNILGCFYGSSSLYQFVPNPPASVVLVERLAYYLNQISQPLVVPLFLLLIPALFVFRKRKASLVVSAAFAGVGFLILYSLLGHPILKYYCLPIYALMYASVSSRETLATVTIWPVISLITPSGAFQLLLPVLGILVLIALLDRAAIKGGGQLPDTGRLPR